jgi:hypothetical protein
VPFDNVTVGAAFVQQNTTFTAPLSGYYLLHVSVGMPASTYADVRTTNSTVVIQRYNTNCQGGPVTTSSYAITYLSQGTSVSVSSAYPLYSDAGLQTSFGGFLLDYIMSPFVAFMVGTSTQLSGSWSPMNFNVKLVDTHNRWGQVAANTYTVPVAGVYIIWFVGGITAGKMLAAGYQVTGDSVYWALMNTYTTFPGNDTGSSIAIVSANVNNSIAFFIKGYASTLTTLTGFLYSPNTIQPVVFYVGASSTTTVGPVDPVVFSKVFVNSGSAWNSTTNKFVSPTDGVYFIQLNVCLPNSYCQHTVSTMELLLNDTAVMNIAYLSPSHIQYDQRSRGILLRLNVRDELRVRLPSGFTFLPILLSFTRVLEAFKCTSRHCVLCAVSAVTTTMNDIAHNLYASLRLNLNTLLICLTFNLSVRQRIIGKYLTNNQLVQYLVDKGVIVRQTYY